MLSNYYFALRCLFYLQKVAFINCEQFSVRTCFHLTAGNSKSRDHAIVHAPVNGNVSYLILAIYFTFKVAFSLFCQLVSPSRNVFANDIAPIADTTITYSFCCPGSQVDYGQHRVEIVIRNL